MTEQYKRPTPKPEYCANGHGMTEENARSSREKRASGYVEVWVCRKCSATAAVRKRARDILKAKKDPCLRCARKKKTKTTRRGFCDKCDYAANKCEREGRPLPLYKSLSRNPLERFFDFVIEDENDCWIWQGFRDKDDYGWFSEEGKTVRAHRWAYENIAGKEIPEGFVMDHFHCEVKSCANPDHVRPVTPQENALRSDSLAARNRAKTHCKRGHEFTERNTIWQTKKGGEIRGRSCRICQNELQLKWYHENKHRK